MGSALALAGQARTGIRHGLEGDEVQGSMSLIYSVPDKIMAEASVALCAICTMASAMLLLADPSMKGSDSWDQQFMLQTYEGLERYQHIKFQAVDHVEVGQIGGNAFQDALRRNPEEKLLIRVLGGQHGGRVSGPVNGRECAENGHMERIQSMAVEGTLEVSPIHQCWLALQEVMAPDEQFWGILQAKYRHLNATDSPGKVCGRAATEPPPLFVRLSSAPGKFPE